MTDTNTKTAQLAREWAQTTQPKGDAKTRAAIEHIMATTTEPTMADVEWDDEKHYLAGATSEIDNSECVMLAPRNGMILNAKPGNDRVSLTSSGALTPNGKRYELREVGATVSSGENVGPDQPQHPATLSTEEDYENAPEGTVVASPDGFAWTKDRVDSWEHPDAWSDDRDMAVSRKVLRWGWGDES